MHVCIVHLVVENAPHNYSTGIIYLYFDTVKVLKFGKSFNLNT